MRHIFTLALACALTASLGGCSGSSRCVIDGCEEDSKDWDLLTCPASIELGVGESITIKVDIEDPCECESSFVNTIRPDVTQGLEATLDDKNGRQHRELTLTCRTEGPKDMVVTSKKEGEWSDEATVSVMCTDGAGVPDLSLCDESPTY